MVEKAGEKLSWETIHFAYIAGFGRAWKEVLW